MLASLVAVLALLVPVAPVAAAAPAPASVPATASAPAAASAPAPVAAPVARFLQFQSPSGNIHCYVSTGRRSGQARCDILRKRFDAPAPPPRCRGDWGHALGVSKRGVGRFQCVYDSAYSEDSRLLRYGYDVRVGTFRCVSRRSGMLCRNVRTDHGFKVARGGYRLF